MTTKKKYFPREFFATAIHQASICFTTQLPLLGLLSSLSLSLTEMITVSNCKVQTWETLGIVFKCYTSQNYFQFITQDVCYQKCLDHICFLD